MHKNLIELKELTNKLQEKDRQLEAQRHTYKALVELLPEIVIVHKNKEILFINEYGLELLGYEYKHEVIGRNIKDFIHKKDIEKVNLLLKNLKVQARHKDFLDLRFIKKDNSIILGEVGCANIIWNNENAIQTVIRDITKRKNIESALLKYYHKTGDLNSIPISGHNTYELGDGWTISLIEQRDNSDTYVIKANKNKKLPVHHHIQKETIKVEKGSIILKMNGDKIILNEGDSYIIPSMYDHGLTAVEDSKLIVEFTPPLSYEI